MWQRGIRGREEGETVGQTGVGGGGIGEVLIELGAEETAAVGVGLCILGVRGKGGLWGKGASGGAGGETVGQRRQLR